MSRKLSQKTMSKPWEDYTSADDEDLYSPSFNLEEVLASYEQHTMKVELLNTTEELVPQESLTSEFHQKEKEAMQEEIAALKEQLSNERMLRQKVEDAKGIDMVTYKLHLESEAAKQSSLAEELHKTKEELKTQTIMTTNLQEKFQRMEKTMQYDIDCLKGQVAAEATLRKKAEKDKGTATKVRENSLQKELEKLKQLRESDKVSFTKTQQSLKAYLQNSFDQKKTKMQEEIDCLKGQVAAEATLRKKAEKDNRTASKVGENSLQKELEELKQLRESDKVSFSKAQADLQKMFDEKKKTMQDEITRLNKLIVAEAKSRMRARVHLYTK